MLSYVIGGGLVVLAILLFILGYFFDKNYHDNLSGASTILAVILVVVGICWLIITPLTAMTDNMQYNNFVMQKQFYSVHVPKSSLEDVTITKDKIERNDWLYDAQYYKRLFGDWCTLPNEVLDLEPIP